MPIYKVTYQQSGTYEVVVDADSPEDARSKVETDSYTDAYIENHVDWDAPEVSDVTEVDLKWSFENGGKRGEWVAVEEVSA